MKFLIAKSSNCARLQLSAKHQPAEAVKPRTQNNMKISEYTAAYGAQKQTTANGDSEAGFRTPNSDAVALRLLETGMVHLFIANLLDHMSNLEISAHYGAKAHIALENFHSGAHSASSAKFAQNAALSSLDDASFLSGCEGLRNVCASLAELAEADLEYDENKIAEAKKNWDDAAAKVAVVTEKTHERVGMTFRRYAKWERSAINKAQHVAAALGLDSIMQVQVKTDSKNCPIQTRWVCAKPKTYACP